MADTTSQRSLKFVLLTPSKKLVDSEASEVCVPAYLGDMGVLPGHAPMVVQLGFGVLSYVRGGERQFFAVESGVAEIRDNVVTVLADCAEPAASVDVDRARKALTRAQERRRGGTAAEQVDMERADKAEARAQARLDAAARLSLTVRK
jgi:F-type H+-transporting ATPase subunit epsilon